jgi:hypothetical protein
MKYTVETLSDLEIVIVDASGPISQEIRKETYLKAVYELKASGFHKLLIDVTNSKLEHNHKSRTINTLDMITFMYINKFKAKKQLKIAVLSLDDEAGHKNFIKLAQIIGRINIKYFRNKDEAINWRVTVKCCV